MSLHSNKLFHWLEHWYSNYWQDKRSHMLFEHIPAGNRRVQQKWMKTASFHVFHPSTNSVPFKNLTNRHIVESVFVPPNLPHIRFPKPKVSFLPPVAAKSGACFFRQIEVPPLFFPNVACCSRESGQFFFTRLLFSAECLSGQFFFSRCPFDSFFFVRCLFSTQNDFDALK